MKPESPSPSHADSLYWSYYTPEEQQALRQVPPLDLLGEINLLRFYLCQCSEYEQSAGAQTYQQCLQSLKACGHAAAGIGVLLRTRLKIQGRSSHWDAVIQAAYARARQQLAVPEYLNPSGLEETLP